MLAMQQYKTDLTNIIENLPEEKIVELMDFARFLSSKYSGIKSDIDGDSLLMQQKALSQIWDSPEEDLYEL